MKCLLLVLVPASLVAGQARFARMGDFEGKVDVQLQAADPWAAAERNLPLPESTWLRTGASSKLEIELDEGSAWRLGPDSLAEISDYSRLSTGQRVTLLSLDRGLAYFTGEPLGKDALSLAVPGAQITFIKGARVRLEAQDSWSRITVIEGAVRFSSPAAEMDLREGQSVRVEPANPSRFFLDRSPAPMELDRWSENRDQALEAPASATHVIQRYGLKDLDTSGQWIQTSDLGMVWKPTAADGWAPFQNGRWRWYDGLGYTWVSGDSWGWLPYHYGRWTRSTANGWVWAPTPKPVFKPGDVYWLRGAKFAGWGPLAPGEDWSPAATPQLYSDATTTFASFQVDARVIDPAALMARPLNPMAAAAFTLALPSPAFIPARLEALRPALRVGSTRVNPIIPGVTFEDTQAQPAPEAPPPYTDPGPIDPPASGPPPDPQAGPPVMYPPPPMYPGIIVVTPPGNPDYSRRGGPISNRQPVPVPARVPQTATGSGTPSGSGQPPAQPAQATRPRVTPAEIPRVEPRHDVQREARNEPKPSPGMPPPSAPSAPPVKPPEVRPRVTPIDVPRVEPRHPSVGAPKPEAKTDNADKPAATKSDAPATSTGAKK